MTGFELSRNLRAAQLSDPSDARDAWMLTLPDVVPELARHWSLELGSPFQPGGTASWVAPARDTAGARLALKVGFPHYEALHEAAGLAAWDGQGTVRLVDAVQVGVSCVLLLEACEPGTALSEVLSPVEQDAVIADLLRQLWIVPPEQHPFRPLQQMCDMWADGFQRRYAAALGPRLDPGLARLGCQLFRDLAADADRCVLLATDLHAGNVLAAHREPWLVIDPKPYAGDPTYDVLQHMLNCPDRLASDPLTFVARLADQLDLDRGRLRQWLFARCVIESTSRPDLRSAAVALAP